MLPGCANGSLSRSFDSGEILGVRPAHADGVVDSVTEAVPQDRVVDIAVSALPLWTRKVFMGRHPIRQVIGYGFEVAGSARFLGTETLRHLARDLSDVPQLGGGVPSASPSE